MSNQEPKPFKEKKVLFPMGKPITIEMADGMMIEGMIRQDFGEFLLIGQLKGELEFFVNKNHIKMFLQAIRSKEGTPIIYDPSNPKGAK